MQPDRWDRVVELFHAAREKAGEERAALLESACGGDPALRQSVEQMLRDDAASDSFLNESSPHILAATEFSVTSSLRPKFGRYEIVAPLGRGGMGEVYLARDAELDRRVALKVLPAQFTRDEERVARFRREARAASALSHPNIVTIYDIGETEGIRYIAAELIDGISLRNRLALGRMDLQEALDVAIQCAGALEAAHEAGIVHRDIKPENIMVRRDGMVKLVDFGLARTVGAASEALVNATETGAVFGTPRYMSPEQARGQKLDARTDIFSLGAVLYEMITGRPAFPGATTADVFAALLNSAPGGSGEGARIVPDELDTIVSRALEKDRDLRYQHVYDMRTDLKRLKRDTDSGRSAAAVSAVSDRSGAASSERPAIGDEGVAATARPVRKRWPLVAGAVAMITMALAIGWYASRSRRHPSEMTERQLTVNSFDAPVVDAAISPDGNSLAYADTAGLYLKLIASGEVHPLSTPAKMRISRIAWFPNSQDLLFTTVSSEDAKRQLWEVSVFGDAPRLLRSDVREASVSSDGSEIAFTTGSADGIWVMEANGEQAKKVVVPKEGSFVVDPAWYPKHRRILYRTIRARTIRDVFEYSLESFDLESRQSLTLVPASREVVEFCVLPDGRILYGSAQSWEIRTDPGSGRATGKPHLLTGAVANQPGPSNGTGVAHRSVSADGKRLVLLKKVAEVSFFVTDLKEGGKRLENLRRTTHGASEYVHAWTPDSQAIVFESDANGNWNIFKQGLNRRAPEPLVTGNEDVLDGRFSPDGKWLFYLLRKVPELSLMRRPAAGGVPELVLSGIDLVNYYCARPPANVCVVGEKQQKQLVFYRFNPTQELPAGGMSPSQLQEIARTDWDPTDWGLSADGTSIAMVKPEAREGRIRVLSFGNPAHPGAVTTRDVLVNGWTNLYTLNWAADGKGWYVANQMSPGALAVSTASVSCEGCRFLYVDLEGRATVLQTPDSTEPPWGVPSPDGRRLAFANRTEEANAWLIENF